MDVISLMKMCLLAMIGVMAFFPLALWLSFDAINEVFQKDMRRLKAQEERNKPIIKKVTVKNLTL
ncbi:hypothetical protein [Ligilactobacillus saerimneri]|uniref:Uncharacterized protein n=2 Tax=Ligilactobacillus saerimneri TaxID=228229 RepID=M5J7T8_9LACO|nr:hypothetical protein [Ligilactobacillus saerimneri]EKW99089.1 hypothetical protein D271_03939 [Ligilactobacillus saerimneri 30a]MBU5309882.1 hypothetical protein [Ligilactobacillus saerimneri]MCZ0891275.1 hypothetical protein [Ligilactobacillus saerimneri]MDI9206821.1 hypothetical protein [Ligilactobacillus saerimneri]MDY4003393.1 hypothetical protein [Ligilactobacillus saerimneri]